MMRTALCLLAFGMLEVQAALAALPANWAEKDIGATGIAGSANASAGAWTVAGSGTDIWGNADAFHYAYQRLNGNGSVILRVTGVGNMNVWAKGGILIREDLTPGSRHAMIAVTLGNGVSLLSRATPGTASTSVNTAGLVAPRWIKLTRAGDRFTAYQSADGAVWTLACTTRLIGMQPSVLAGIAICSHDNTRLSNLTATGSKSRTCPCCWLRARRA